MGSAESDFGHISVFAIAAVKLHGVNGNEMFRRHGFTVRRHAVYAAAVYREKRMIDRIKQFTDNTGFHHLKDIQNIVNAT